MKTIKKVDVFSVAKISGFLFAILGLIPGTILGLLSLLIPANSGFPHSLGFVGVIIFPILYGVIGFIMGMLSSALYNLSAKYIGGIKIELEETTTPQV